MTPEELHQLVSGPFWRLLRGMVLQTGSNRCIVINDHGHAYWPSHRAVTLEPPRRLEDWLPVVEEDGTVGCLLRLLEDLGCVYSWTWDSTAHSKGHRGLAYTTPDQRTEITGGATLGEAAARALIELGSR